MSSEGLLPVGKGSGLTDQIIVNQRFASYVTNPKCFVWCSTSIMAMHISQYCEVFDMKHLWSIWMHLNQLYVAKKYRLLWKLIVEAFASLSTCPSWYFDRDKYKLWFRSRRLTPFNQFVSHYCQSMTQLACDVTHFLRIETCKVMDEISCFRYWRQTAWLATAMLVTDASRVLLIAAFIGISSSYPNGWLQRLRH